MKYTVGVTSVGAYASASTLFDRLHSADHSFYRCTPGVCDSAPIGLETCKRRGKKNGSLPELTKVVLYGTLVSADATRIGETVPCVGLPFGGRDDRVPESHTVVPRLNSTSEERSTCPVTRVPGLGNSDYPRVRGARALSDPVNETV